MAFRNRNRFPGKILFNVFIVHFTWTSYRSQFSCGAFVSICLWVCKCVCVCVAVHDKFSFDCWPAPICEHLIFGLAGIFAQLRFWLWCGWFGLLGNFSVCFDIDPANRIESLTRIYVYRSRKQFRTDVDRNWETGKSI